MVTLCCPIAPHLCLVWPQFAAARGEPPSSISTHLCQLFHHGPIAYHCCGHRVQTTATRLLAQMLTNSCNVWAIESNLELSSSKSTISCFQFCRSSSKSKSSNSLRVLIYFHLWCDFYLPCTSYQKTNTCHLFVSSSWSIWYIIWWYWTFRH